MAELERRARKIAALKMGLSNDGERLPDELWRQAIPQAERELATEAKDQALAAAEKAMREIEGGCPVGEWTIEEAIEAKRIARTWLATYGSDGNGPF